MRLYKVSRPRLTDTRLTDRYTSSQEGSLGGLKSGRGTRTESFQQVWTGSAG